jgi:ribonuclease D
MNELYIDTDAALQSYVAEIASTATLALDTEFVREKTYYPQLCLVQIATANTIACIDCLAPIDFQPLFERLLCADSEWIVHSSRQDLEVIYQHTPRLPDRLIDTQIAAGLIGYPPQIGLQDILVKQLGVELAKEHTRTDWSRRPLPEGAIAYARDDVRSLHALWAALSARLDELGRLDWLDQDCALLISQAPITPPEQIWARLRGLRRLDTAGRSAALTLIEWRERRAQSRDRPRRWLLGDEQLLAIARDRPGSLDGLRAVPDLPPRLVERAGGEILAAIDAANEPTNLARAERLADDEPPDKRQLRELQTAVKDLAATLGIYPEVLATKQELLEVLLGRLPVRIASTWRATQLGELIGVDL